MPPFPELKDITPPTPPPFSSPDEVQALVWQVFAGVVVVVLLGTLWLWWRWRARRAAPPPLPRSALDQLRDHLASLQSNPEALPARDLGHEVAGAVRSYLQREHGLMARYRTTEELFGTHRGPRRADAPPPLPFLRPFAEVFTRCDSLKFDGPGGPGSPRHELVALALRATEDVRAALAPRPHPPAGGMPPLPPPLPPPADPAAPPLPIANLNPASGLPDHQPPRSEVAPRITSPAIPPLRVAPGPRSDAFTRPPSNAFARGADIIPA